MSARFELEDFDGPGQAAAPAGVGTSDPRAVEAARVEGYEAGYKSGWDDAVRAAAEDARSVGAELARNLRDLNFTYFEARDEVLAALKPFLADLLDTLFPELLPEVAGAAIARELTDRVRDASNGMIRILVSPDDAAVVRSLLAEQGTFQAEVVEEAALASGQVRLTSDRRDVVIDPETLLGQLRASLSGTQRSGGGDEAADETESFGNLPEPKEATGHG